MAFMKCPLLYSSLDLQFNRPDFLDKPKKVVLTYENEEK